MKMFHNKFKVIATNFSLKNDVQFIYALLVRFKIFLKKCNYKIVQQKFYFHAKLMSLRAKTLYFLISFEFITVIIIKMYLLKKLLLIEK
jgi:hypothetical protein